MTSVRALAARVARLEQGRTRQFTPIEAAYGSLEAFEELTRSQIEEGKLCAADMDDVLKALRRWHSEGAWSSWKRTVRHQLEFAG